METLSSLLAFCVWNPPVTGGFPLQRSVTRSFEFFLYVPEQTLEEADEIP